MKVTIDGITYEGTEEEIRRIVENPPTRQIPKVGDCPDNDRNYLDDDDEDAYKYDRHNPYNIDPYPPVRPTPTPIPIPPAYPYVPTWPVEIPRWPNTEPTWPRNWDGTPIVTCLLGGL